MTVTAETLARLSGAGTPFDFPEAIGYSRQPFASAPGAAWQAVAGPNGVAIGSFGWLNTDTGQIANVYAAASLLVFVLPIPNVYNAWERMYIQRPLIGDIFNGLATIQNGLAALTVVESIFGYLQLGSPLFGNGIQAGTTVADLGSYSWQTGGTLTMSLPATLDAGPQTVTGTAPANAPPFAQMIVRPGTQCVAAVQGVFRPKFPLGGLAGSRVYVDPATGLPYATNPGGYIATPYTLTQTGLPGANLTMSSFVNPFN
jgi:hypothetical protein